MTKEDLKLKMVVILPNGRLCNVSEINETHVVLNDGEITFLLDEELPFKEQVGHTCAKANGMNFYFSPLPKGYL